MMSSKLRGTLLFLAGIALGLFLAGVLIFVYASVNDINLLELQSTLVKTSESRHTDPSAGLSKDQLSQGEHTEGRQTPSTVVAPSSGSEFPRDATSPADEFMNALKAIDDIGHISDEQIGLIQRTALDWAEREGTEAIHAMSGAMQDDLRIVVLDYVLQEIVQSDPIMAFDATLSLKEAGGRTHLREVVWNWAAFDPKSALHHLASVDLDEELRSSLQYAAINRWAARDPDAVISSVEQIPEDLRNVGLSLALRLLAQTSPERASRQIGVIHNDVGSKRSAARLIAQEWLKTSVSDTLQWIATSPDLEYVRKSLYSDVLQDLSETDAPTAFRLALEQPIEGNEIGMEASVIERLAYGNDLDKALELLKDVRPGATRTAASTSVGHSLARNGDLEQALALADQLPETSRTGYLIKIAMNWGVANPGDVVEQIDRLPTDELRSKAAITAWGRGQMEGGNLSSDQLERLKSYMLEEELKSLEEFQMMLPNLVE